MRSTPLSQALCTLVVAVLWLLVAADAVRRWAWRWG